MNASRRRPLPRWLGVALVAGSLFAAGAGLEACTAPTATQAPSPSATARATVQSIAATVTPIATTVATGPPAPTSTTAIQDRDREQIRATVEGYFAALQAQDRDRLRQYLHDPEHVGTATLDQLLAQQRDHQYQLDEIVDTRIQSEHATVTVRLREHDGESVTQGLTLEREHGSWGIDDPGHNH